MLVFVEFQIFPNQLVDKLDKIYNKCYVSDISFVGQTGVIYNYISVLFEALTTFSGQGSGACSASSLGSSAWNISVRRRALSCWSTPLSFNDSEIAKSRGQKER